MVAIAKILLTLCLCSLGFVYANPLVSVPFPSPICDPFDLQEKIHVDKTARQAAVLERNGFVHLGASLFFNESVGGGVLIGPEGQIYFYFSGELPPHLSASSSAKFAQQMKDIGLVALDQNPHIYTFPIPEPVSSMTEPPGQIFISDGSRILHMLKTDSPFDVATHWGLTPHQNFELKAFRRATPRDLREAETTRGSHDSRHLVGEAALVMTFHSIDAGKSASDFLIARRNDKYRPEVLLVPEKHVKTQMNQYGGL